MVARCFPAGGRVCGRRDLNPHERLSSADFLTGYGFRRPWPRESQVCGLDYPFTVPGRAGVRCCPSSLYTFPAGRLRPGLARDRHMTGFPEFGQFCIAGFPASTQVRLKSAASAIPPRPRGTP